LQPRTCKPLEGAIRGVLNASAGLVELANRLESKLAKRKTVSGTHSFRNDF
jgi:predicted methyltransferase MtxX (methanogen marker protein 4)